MSIHLYIFLSANFLVNDCQHSPDNISVSICISVCLCVRLYNRLCVCMFPSQSIFLSTVVNILPVSSLQTLEIFSSTKIMNNSKKQIAKRRGENNKEKVMTVIRVYFFTSSFCVYFIIFFFRNISASLEHHQRSIQDLLSEYKSIEVSTKSWIAISRSNLSKPKAQSLLRHTGL